MRCRSSLHVIFVLLSFVALTGAAEASSGMLVGNSARAATASAAAAPQAAFTYSPARPVTGQSVHFDGSRTTCASSPCTYTWADDPPSGGSWALGSGQTITFTFSYVGTKYVTLSVTDSLNRTATVEHNVVVAAGGPPSNSSPPTISGAAQQGQTLTASNGSWTGTPTSYTYQWQDCTSSTCSNISGSTSSTYRLQSSDVGHTIDVVEKATNASGSGSAASAKTGTVSAPSAPTAAFTYSPTSPVTGQSVDFDGSTTTCAASPCTYTWADEPPSGGSWALGSGQTMNFTFNDVGTKYVTLSVTDSLNRTATVEHNVAVGTGGASNPPVNTGVPTISGSAVQGQTLSTSNGSWSNSPTSYSYAWQDCDSSGSNCASVSGATGSSYTLVGGDVGHTVRSVVTASNSGGSKAASAGQTAVVTSEGSSPFPGTLACDLNATASNFAAQIAAASPGQVVCLASGDYSGFTGTSKAAPGITITSAPGAAVTFNSGMTLNMSTSQNFTLDGTAGGGTMSVGGTLDLETRSDAEQIKALNLTFQNLSFPTGNLPNVILFGPEQANIAFNRDTFVDGNGACSNGNGLGRPGNFYVYNTGTPTTQTGLTVENSVFVAPMDLWNPGRTVQDGAPMAFENNVLTGYVAHNDNAACVHIDGLQWFSGTPGTTGSVTFTGNLCYDDYGCALAFDGTSDNTVTDNVCFSMERSCTTLFADANSIYNHNAFETGGADPGYCNSMHSPQIGQMACTISRSFENGTKGGADPNPSGEVFTNNVSQAAPTVTAGSTATNSNNLYSGATAPNINGTPTFAGGADPTTWAGFELTAGSAGHTAGSDGLDVGIRASAGGPPTGGGSAPVNTVAPVLSGTATNGSTLTTTNGTWTITGGVPTAVTYQWFDCTTNSFSVSASTCQPIQPFNPASSTNSASNAANLSTLTISTAGPPAGVNVGDYVFAMVTETNANGQVNAISNPAGPVAP